MPGAARLIKLGNVAKLEGNSFYGKMIEDLDRHKSTKLTREEWVDDKTLRSPFFDALEEICGTYEIKEREPTVMIKRPYQCGIAVYQLAKLRMLEFFNDFLDKYFSRQDLKLCYMDTDSIKRINIAAKVFQRIIMTCIFSGIRMSWMFF